jgi:adenosylcobinamide-GDP ribazoletransferase
VARFGKKFLSTFSLVSRVPAGKDQQPDFSWTGFYLPIVGVIVSALCLGLYVLLIPWLPEPFLILLVIVTVQYLLFNLFHFDGLLDTADGLAVHADKERRLAILKDVAVGAFGLFFGVLYLAVKLYVLYRVLVFLHIFSLPTGGAAAVALLFFSYPLSGRVAAALVPLGLPPAKNDGLGALLTGYTPVKVAAGAVLSIGIVVLPLIFFIHELEGTPGPLFALVFCGGIAAFIGTTILYARKIGGFTGDTLGFAVELGELAHMVIFYLVLVFAA